VIVRLVDIGEIVNHRGLYFLFIIILLLIYTEQMCLEI